MRMRLIACVLAICIGGTTAPMHGYAQTASVPTASPLVVTSGRGEVHIAPDGASLAVAVESRASTASAAAALNATATTSTLASLRAAGLAMSQLSTTGFSVATDYARPPIAAGSSTLPQVTFIARNGVRIEIKDLTTLSKIIDAALAGGATQIGQVRFTSSSADRARREALAQAVARARSDADAIAEASGGTLGALVEMNSLAAPYNTYFDVVTEQSAFAGGNAQATHVLPPAPPTPLAPGDVAVTANVVARWTFVPKR